MNTYHFSCTLHRKILSFLLALVVPLLMAVGISMPDVPAHASATIPNSGALTTYIVGTSKVVFKPTHMQVNLQHTSAVAVQNNTRKTQVVLDANGIQMLQLAPHTHGFLAFDKLPPGTYVYHLQNNSKATFTVTTH